MDYGPPSKATLSRLRKLQRKKGRDDLGSFLAEGPKVVAEAFHANLSCRSLLLAEDFALPPDVEALLGSGRLPRDRVFTLPSRKFYSLCSTQTPQGILAEFKLPQSAVLTLLGKIGRPVVVLHEVQDPGNVGTAIRCTAALGGGGVLLTEGCADLWNPKTVRASAGACFRLPIWTGLSPSGAKAALIKYRDEIWVADAKGSSVREIEAHSGRLAIVFGNESRGVGDFYRDAPSARLVGIPMQGGVESLNVGVAVGIMLTQENSGTDYELT